MSNAGSMYLYNKTAVRQERGYYITLRVHRVRKKIINYIRLAALDMWYYNKYRYLSLFPI